MMWRDFAAAHAVEADPKEAVVWSSSLMASGNTGHVKI